MYGNLVISLSMMKWCPPKGRELAPVCDDHLLALAYTPWRTSGYPSSKEINEASFAGWYAKMVNVTAIVP